MKLRTVALASGALALGLALTLTGCSAGMSGMDMGVGSGTASTAPAQADYNDPDIAFATQMIPHHQQAVEMAEILLAKTGVNPDVVAVAKQIKAEQDPEIVTMTGWLKTWGQPIPAAMDGMTMDGMMSPADLNALKSASGPDSSTLFLQQMVQHHQGAIAMAQTEVDTGKNDAALALAKDIIAAQTAEIATMQQLLASV